MSIDLLNPNILKQAFTELRQPENLERKREAYECLQVYKERQKDLICRELCLEYDKQTMANMRKFTSLNLTRRIVHTEASIYKKAPERILTETASDNEINQFNALYEWSHTNKMMKIANRYKVLFSQCAVQLIPKHGVIKTRVLTPFHYDVIPMWDDPEQAMAYIVQMNSNPMSMTNNTFDFEIKSRRSTYDGGNLMNEVIADEDDDMLNALRYVVWTKDLNFISDGKGRPINPETNMPFGSEIRDEDVMNPIGMLPFIDVADQKDFEFWVDRGCNLAEFALDIGKMDCDTAEVNRLQGYSQPIISATHMPKELRVGPNTVLFLEKKVNGDPSKDPEFQFASPNPDLESSIKLRNAYINTFLTSRGLDKSVINTDGETQSFSSGVERHLAKIERFEESQDDLDLFRGVEHQYFNIMRAWSNSLQGVPMSEGGLVDQLQGGQIREDIEMFVKFDTPEMMQTKTEKEDSITKKVEAGRMSVIEAIMEEREVDRDKAIEIWEQIQDDNAMFSGNSMVSALRSLARGNQQEVAEEADSEQS